VVYVPAYHEDGVAGVWAIPVLGGEPNLVVAIPELSSGSWFSVGADRIYVSIGEHESDIWVMDVEVER
jgi:hypothetical protein